MNDTIELASLTAAFKAITVMLAEPFDDDVNRPTPCPGWDVSNLFDHVIDLVIRMADRAGVTMTDQSYMTPQQRLAAVTEPSLEGWRRRQGIHGAIVWRDRRLPDRVAIKVLALDIVVHGWDLAVALDRTLDIADPYVDYLLEFARGALTDDVRATSGFREPVFGYEHGVTMLERLVAFTGRDPQHWNVAAHKSALSHSSDT
jgi:uncharacterized protein (TIGR03086 family)